MAKVDMAAILAEQMAEAAMANKASASAKKAAEAKAAEAAKKAAQDAAAKKAADALLNKAKEQATKTVTNPLSGKPYTPAPTPAPAPKVPAKDDAVTHAQPVYTGPGTASQAGTKTATTTPVVSTPKTSSSSTKTSGGGSSQPSTPVYYDDYEDDYRYSGSSNRQDPRYIEEQKKPKLWTAQELADMYGFIFGQDQIMEILQRGTNARFDEWDSQTRRIRDNALTDYAMANDSYLNSFRNNRQNALQQGITRGQSLAQEMGSLLSTQQQAGQNQTLYQQQLADIAQQRGSQLASDEFTAMKTQNELSNTLGGIASQLYGYDVQDNTGYLSYLGQMGANAANDAMARAQQSSADASTQYYNSLRSQSPAQQSGGQNNDVIANLMSGGLTKSEATLVSLGLADYDAIMAKKQPVNQSTQGSKLNIQPTTPNYWDSLDPYGMRYSKPR